MNNRGQATIEYIVIFPVLVMLLFGIFQFTLIYQAKTTLNYAVFEAARAGAVNNAKREAVEEAFARGMSPLYTHDDTVDDVHAARDQVRDEIAAGDRVCIERVNPVDEDFSDHSIDHPELDGDSAIPVDNLFYRDNTSSAGGGGAAGRVSLHDATLLKIKVTYCYPLYVPFLNRVIPEWFTGNVEGQWFTGNDDSEAHDDGLGEFKLNCIGNRQLPISADAIMRMQSPVINDESYSTAAQCS